MSLNFDYAGFKSLLMALALPPAPMLLLAGWGGWRLKRRRRFGGWMLGGALALTWLSATDAAAELLSRASALPQALRPADVAAMRGRPDGVVLVLGAGVNRYQPEYDGGSLKPRTAERLAYGAWLARRAGWPLAFTGGVGWIARPGSPPEAQVVARIAAEDYRLPLRWAEGRSRDTRENAMLSLPMLAAAGIKEVVLVTDDAHMRRALRAFEAAARPLGLRIGAAPIGLQDDGLSRFSDWCPSETGFARMRNLIYETLAWWAGR